MSSKPSTSDNDFVEESWNLPSDFDLYSKYQIRKVFLPKKERKLQPSETNNKFQRKCNGIQSDERTLPFFNIECIEPNSPLDILNKSSSLAQFDATGHCVWTGAFLLISCMNEIIDFIEENIQSAELIVKESGLDEVNKSQLRMIELGCGTGVGGLSIMMSSLNSCSHPSDHKDNQEYLKSLITCCFTDEDPAVLKVCERNCQLNGLTKGDSYSIEELRWGDEKNPFMQQQKERCDIVLATDVLYDIDLLPPLFETASMLLRQGLSDESKDIKGPHAKGSMNHSRSNRGIFILSHVPRACYNDNNPPEAVEDLEKYIIDQAKEKYGLELMTIIKPSTEPVVGMKDEVDDDSSFFFENAVDSFTGAAILIFKKASSSL